MSYHVKPKKKFFMISDTLEWNIETEGNGRKIKICEWGRESKKDAEKLVSFVSKKIFIYYYQDIIVLTISSNG